MPSTASKNSILYNISIQYFYSVFYTVHSWLIFVAQKHQKMGDMEVLPYSNKMLDSDSARYMTE